VCVCVCVDDPWHAPLTQASIPGFSGELKLQGLETWVTKDPHTRTKAIRL